MPEAPVDEHRDPRFREDHITPLASKTGQREINAIAQSCRMEQSAQGQFRLCVSPGLAGHPGGDRRIASSWPGRIRRRRAVPSVIAASDIMSINAHTNILSLC